MPLLLKGEVDSTRHNSHSMPYWSQISHKITCYEKPQNICDHFFGHKEFQQVISLVIFTVHLNNSSQIRKLSTSQPKVKTCTKRDYGYCLQVKKPLWFNKKKSWPLRLGLHLCCQSVFLSKSVRMSLNPPAKISPIKCPSTTFLFSSKLSQ